MYKDIVMNETVVKLVSILLTFMVFLGALVFMKSIGISKPIRIIVAILLIFVIDYIKGKIFGSKI